MIDDQKQTEFTCIQSSQTPIITGIVFFFSSFASATYLPTWAVWCQVALCAEVWRTLTSIHISFSVAYESSHFRHSYASEISPCSMHLCVPNIVPYSMCQQPFANLNILISVLQEIRSIYLRWIHRSIDNPTYCSISPRFCSSSLSIISDADL